MDVNTYINEHQDELLSILSRLLSIESVASEATAPDAPFGDGCRKVMDEALKIAVEYGFATAEDSGYAFHAQIGEGEGLIGVLAHLDVVPAGDGWASDPYSMSIRDGKIYGRGAIDDKGPAAATLFAMHALKECGVPLNKRVRGIFGCSEENGMEDLQHYFENYEMPEWGFSPDAEYPVINCEKHIFQATFSGTAEEKRIARLYAGERFNVVPETAFAQLAESLTTEEAAAVKAYAAKEGIGVELTGNKITVIGKAAHASHPELGVNAAGHLLRLLVSCGITKDAKLAYLARHVGLETDGASLGMACEDVSGKLTCNLGMLRLENGTLSASFDMRCPVTEKGEDLRSRMAAAAQNGSFTMTVDHYADGILVDADSELIQTLLSVYEEESGRKGECIAIGGGTYARQMPNRAVAFGPCFPEEEDMCHKRDEFFRVDDLMILCRMIAQAIARLAA